MREKVEGNEIEAKSCTSRRTQRKKVGVEEGLKINVENYKAILLFRNFMLITSFKANCEWCN